MRQSVPPGLGVRPRAFHKLKRLSRDEHGAAAIEFALVALPFFMLSFGMIAIGLHFFATTSLEYAAEAASRQIRTGEAKQLGTKVQKFYETICEEAGSFINCDNLRVLIQKASSWDGITPRSCLASDGSLVGSDGDGTDTQALNDLAGGASEVVLVTLCYEWELAAILPFLKLGNMSNGSALLQAATTFRTEPYPEG